MLGIYYSISRRLHQACIQDYYIGNMIYFELVRSINLF